MSLIDSVDPLVMQLVVVPLIAISFGVAAAAISKKVYIGPLITLVLVVSYNNWYFPHSFPSSKLTFPLVFSWCVMYPLVSLFLSWVLILQFKAIKNFICHMTKEKCFQSK
ncbi:hypothetical protein [Planococcus sp. YIM B11945]|uniref:hypothetical protein n=1 Tax=Planococcus sp. YIM B11945 TaxID=3435410 RepID=UPI003D7D61D4